MGWPRRLVLFLSPGGTASRAPRCFISLLSWGPEEVQMSISSPARHHRILSGPDISLCCSRKMTPVSHQACAFGNCSSVHLFVIPKQRFSPKQLVSWRSGDANLAAWLGCCRDRVLRRAAGLTPRWHRWGGTLSSTNRQGLGREVTAGQWQARPGICPHTRHLCVH